MLPGYQAEFKKTLIFQGRANKVLQDWPSLHFWQHLPLPLWVPPMTQPWQWPAHTTSLHCSTWNILGDAIPKPTPNRSPLLEQEPSPSSYQRSTEHALDHTFCRDRAMSYLSCNDWHKVNNQCCFLNTFATVCYIFPWMKDGRPLLSLAERSHFTDFYQTLAAHPSQASNPWPLTHNRLSSHHITLQLFWGKPSSNDSHN